jgi:hypothetical protein
MSGPTVSYDRQQLYDLVWSEAMVRLARRFAVTDVALVKTCKRRGVPVPPRGHWRRKETGDRVRHPALPSVKPGMTTHVQLRLRGPAEGTADVDPEVEAQKAFEAQPENRIVVAQRLAAPHPLIERARGAMAVAKPGPDGCVAGRGSGLDIRVTPKLLPRALRIMDALVKALEARGAKVSGGGSDRRGLGIELLGERLSIFLEEPVKRTRHVLTETEQRHPYRAPRWDYAPTGKLKIEVQECTCEPSGRDGGTPASGGWKMR